MITPNRDHFIEVVRVNTLFSWEFVPADRKEKTCRWMVHFPENFQSFVVLELREKDIFECFFPRILLKLLIIYKSLLLFPPYLCL